ncbi:MAG: NAD(P)-dependent oxidoreductase [Clostridia bacterium]|nr:NAD(P)-dependent oxidoreductase [Clostridia bacterium]
MKARMLITGACGMLATDLLSVFMSNDKMKEIEVVGFDRKQLDITDRENVEQLFAQVRPDFVIHTAAMTNVDLCEEKPEEAFRVNTYGTENISLYCDKYNSKLVYISSCGLFGDQLREYAETDEVVLKTEYAKSKYLGEEMVREYCEKYFIVRPGWLFGGNLSHKKNFVYNRYIEALKNGKMQSALDKYGCPTYTLHLANKIAELITTDLYGCYHITNSSHCTRYGYVKKIIDCFGLHIKVDGVTSEHFVRKAPVPDCEILKNYSLSASGFGLLPEWNLALEEYIFKLKKVI